MNIFKVLNKFFYRFIKGDKRYSFYETLRNNLLLSREQIIEQQNSNLKKLVTHAYHNTQYYRELMDYLKIKPEDINTSGDLHKLPILTKQLIKENLDKLKSKARFSHGMSKITSGGSTGELGIIYRSKYFEAMSRASWLRNNSMVGWMPEDKAVWIWTSPTEHSSYLQAVKVRFGMWLNRRMFLNAFNYSESDFSIWYDKIKKFKPKVVFGNPSIILEFSEYLLDNNLILPSVEIVVTTTEKLKNREVIGKAFKSSVHDQYGCSEIIAIGIEKEANQMYFTDDVVLVTTTHEHEFLLTPLFSYGFPLINYKVGDMGDIQGAQIDPEQFPFLKIHLEIGRITDKFLTKEHRKISTSSLGSYLASLDLGVKEHQLEQNNYAIFTINYVSLETTNEVSYKQKVKRVLEEYFGTDLVLNFNKVPKLSAEQSGKRLMFKRTFLLDL